VNLDFGAHRGEQFVGIGLGGKPFRDSAISFAVRVAVPDGAA
jgi:hypothetical protein